MLPGALNILRQNECVRAQNCTKSSRFSFKRPRQILHGRNADAIQALATESQEPRNSRLERLSSVLTISGRGQRDG